MKIKKYLIKIKNISFTLQVSMYLLYHDDYELYKIIKNSQKGDVKSPCPTAKIDYLISVLSPSSRTLKRRAGYALIKITTESESF